MDRGMSKAFQNKDHNHQPFNGKHIKESEFVKYFA